MKDKSIERYLFDILDAIRAIRTFTEDVIDYKVFASSRLLTSASH